MAAPRIHIAHALSSDLAFDLPEGAARHVQVLRLQPGTELALFDGLGGQWQAEIVAMGRKQVSVRLAGFAATECELITPVTLALGMPANERMDGLVEKATELGVAAIQPLVCERSVLRLTGERAQRKTAHWQAVAVAACEQSGRNRVPQIAPPLSFSDWLAALLRPGDTAAAAATAATTARRWLLSLSPQAQPLARRLSGLTSPGAAAGLTLLSGPEGGLSPAEIAGAEGAGFSAVSLGPRVLRADTAPLAALACVAASQAYGVEGVLA